VAFQQAEVALRAGDLALYQQKVDEARAFVEQANQIIADAAAAAGSGSSA
jgi:Tfp pilus assembly protein PilX